MEQNTPVMPGFVTDCYSGFTQHPQRPHQQALRFFGTPASPSHPLLRAKHHPGWGHIHHVKGTGKNCSRNSEALVQLSLLNTKEAYINALGMDK